MAESAAATSGAWRSGSRPGEGIAGAAGMLEGEGCEAEEFFRAMVQAEEET